MRPIVSPLLFATVFLCSSTGAYSQKKGKTDYASEIKVLAEKPIVKKAFQTIVDLDPQTLKQHIMLTQIPAPPFKEQERAAKFAALLKEAGADSVWIDNVGNVIAKRKGKSGKKTVVIEGHLDTVFPEGTDVTVVQKGDTLYAPGIIDDTRALAGIWTILTTLEKNGIETDADVLFCGVVGEEGLGDLRGVKNLLSEHGPGPISSYIAIDGWNISRVTHRGLGSKRYKVLFKGPGGHSFGAFGLANPHAALGRTIHYWDESADAFSRMPGERVTYNVGVIGGGTSVNAIPFESWMEVDMRSESPERLKGMDELLQAAARKALDEENKIKRSGADLTLKIELIGDRPSGMLDSSLPLIQRAKEAVKFLGTEPVLAGGSTNSNIPISLGIPAVTIGSGGKGANEHALNEWWINDKGYLAIQRALLLLLAESGIAK
ncbi:M20/M25/M40 family metallo-hydrolase [Chitinophaga silvatica]|uniref:M20/M25/M40 family metallo-hydrolase n=1 Tax=Chitinophaga silvatica TaxID=2282649 RepID=A0A3E1Y3P2_9BACT|nr:M20/M25/M40 family metallo-hydrolase [Chitinophaga silvatica]RFS19304.1 M20/M25/M40 family metallo-hydrolase [Chitinophaga silvatica]